MRRKKGLVQRILSVALSVILSSGVVLTALPMETWATGEIEDGSGEKVQYEIVSFAEIPEEIRWQSVEVGTPVEELELPDTLTVTYRLLVEDLEDSENQGAEEEEMDSEENTENEETETEENTESENEETETEDITEIEQNTEESEAGGANTSDGAAENENGAESYAEITQKTVVVHMEEYLAEPDYITVNTLSASDSEHAFKYADKEIEGITWISTPEYNVELAGSYVLTPVLPEEYGLCEGVELPEIIVTVGEATVTVAAEEAAEPASIIISEDTTWSARNLTLINCTMIVEEDVTLTIMEGITIYGDVTIEGGGTIERGSARAYFYLPPGSSSLTLRNITVDGQGQFYKGLDSMVTALGGTVTLGDGCTIMNCSDEYTGGAVYVENGGNVNFEGAVIMDCSATYGGAIHLQGSTAYISNTEFINCTAEFHGGAMFMTNNATIYNMSDTEFTNCSATYGGAISINDMGTTAYISNTEFTKCSALNRGGAIDIAASSVVNLQNVTIKCCKAENSGGCISINNSELIINGGSFIGNTAANMGGCIYHSGNANTTTHLSGGYFKNNTCTNENYYGSGAFFVSLAATETTNFFIDGNNEFVGYDNDSGTDGIYLNQQYNKSRIGISNTLSHPLTIYTNAIDGYVIAEGSSHKITNSDRRKISFVDVNDDGPWFTVLDKENNQIYITKIKPQDTYFVYYYSNGAEGMVKDDNNGDDGYEAGTTITVQSADGLSWEGHSFVEWNTQADGKGKSYHPGDKFEITEDINLYAIFSNSGTGGGNVSEPDNNTADNNGNNNSEPTSIPVQTPTVTTPTTTRTNNNNGINTTTPDTGSIGTSIVETVPVNSSQKDKEPKTGVSDYPQFYASMAMIVGLSYIMIMFFERHGMTEDEKSAYISRIISWAKRGGRLRRLLAVAAIFMVLVYYHSVGKQSVIELKSAY